MRMRFKGKDRDAFFGFFIPQVGEAHLLGSGVVVLLLLALYPEVQETVLAHLSRRPKLWLGVGFIAMTALLSIYYGFSSAIPHPLVASSLVFGSSVFSAIVGIYCVDACFHPDWQKLLFAGTVQVQGNWRWYELIVPGMNFAQSIMTLVLLRLAKTNDLLGRFIPGNAPIWLAAVCSATVVAVFVTGKIKEANPWITASYGLAISFGVADVFSRRRGEWRR